MFIQRKTDIYYIDAIEDTEAYYIKKNDLVYLFDNFPEKERYVHLSMGSVFRHFLERITFMRFTSAKEKYIHFRETYFDIYHQITLGMDREMMVFSQHDFNKTNVEL